MTHDEEIALGRRLIESGENPPDMLSHLAICEYLKHERQLVARYGCCGHTNESWMTPMGACVCKHTRNPCPRQSLALVLELFSLINRGEHEQRVTSKRAARRKHHSGRQA